MLDLAKSFLENNNKLKELIKNNETDAKIKEYYQSLQENIKEIDELSALVEEKQKQLQEIYTKAHETKEEMELAWNRGKQLVKEISDLTKKIRMIVSIVNSVVIILSSLLF